jgi:alkylation response protein AidB-like acyl-CoA dehydrogenase
LAIKQQEGRMQVVYSEDQAEYQRQVRSFVERELRPLVETEYDFSRPLTRDDVSGIRSRIASHEIAVTAPRREGGQLDLICFSIFIEEVSKLHFGFGSLAMAIFFEVWDMIDLLNDAQRARYERLFAPGALMSIAISEPNVGSNPSQIEATATRTADGWVLNGTKLWTSHAQISDGIMVACRKLDDGDDQGVSLFIVDRAEQEYDVRSIPCLGMDATSVCEVTFDECWLPAEAEATRGRGGLRSALHLVEQARLRVVSMAVGAAQASLDLAVEYAKSREQFGRPIASFQMVQGMLAEMATQIEAARLLGYRAASLLMAGESARVAMSMAKSFATDIAVDVTSKGIQIHGAMGLTKECKAERYFRDAKMLTIPDGTTQIHQLVIGKALTGISAFG